MAVSAASASSEERDFLETHGLSDGDTNSKADDGNSPAGAEGTALDGEHEITHDRDEGHEREGDSSTDPETTDQNHQVRPRVTQVNPGRSGRGERARDPVPISAHK